MVVTEEKLTTEEINNNMLLGTDNKGLTDFHLLSEKCNLELLYKLWEMAKKELTKEETNNKLLLDTDTGEHIGTN